ncbi:helix-turn-helix transcriptional regulator [Croceicoccus gelatinilyticus]|uniref:helix-turn-helix transcriptional regulator n=1 Tax=Croceicoccus gelatinilyticus TaxID=2835536 RepID=UPI001BCE1CB1|nr:AlpA family phage regulatory protein [Croceicoccus gelatinilyticus]MBS7670976.1 AlpA family phage regulatory protein [Croceicoccus gelatinilyticus]
MTTLLRLDAVKERTALSRSHIYELLERGEFPRPVKLSGRINAWPDNEIDGWIKARIAEREAA